MAFIKLRIGSDIHEWVNARAILRIKPRVIDGESCSEVVLFGETSGIYEETPDQIIDALEQATGPKIANPLNRDELIELRESLSKQSDGQEVVAWSREPEAMLNRTIGGLEAQRDSARRTASIEKARAEKLEDKVKVLDADLQKALESLDFQVKQRANLQALLADWKRVANKFASNPEGPRLVTSPSELEDFLERNQETEQHLESQLKAWQDAASVQLVEDSDEARTQYQTPEQFIERLRQLYRWASTADAAASEASVKLGVCEMKLEKASAEVAQLNGKLKTWEKVDRTRGESESESIHWPRVYATAIEVAQYQQDKFGESKEAYVCEAAVGLLRALIKLGSCDPVRCHPVKWH